MSEKFITEIPEFVNCNEVASQSVSGLKKKKIDSKQNLLVIRFFNFTEWWKDNFRNR